LLQCAVDGFFNVLIPNPWTNSGIHNITLVSMRKSYIIEQDHRSIKRIVKPMLGFKSFRSASATLAGIELCHMLKKGQHIDSGKSTSFESFYALAA
jgi:transposase-like protein